MSKRETPFFRRKLVRIERHRLGPRVFLLGVRWHDWHVGALVLLLLALGAAAGRVHDSLPTGLAAAVGLWLIAKDWRDLTPRRRDTAAWRLGLHRRPFALRRFRRADPLPLLASVAAAAIALVDLLSALTPNVSWRGHLLLQIGSVQELRVFHALAIPVAIVLFVSAYYLYRRHLRALQLAVLLLLALSVRRSSGSAVARSTSTTSRSTDARRSCARPSSLRRVRSCLSCLS